MRLILNKKNFMVFKVLILILPLLINQVWAQDLRIKISSGQVEPLPIAIANFTGQDGKANEIGRQISEVISRALELSDTGEISDNVKNGLTNREKFSWAKTAEQTLKVYSELLN